MSQNISFNLVDEPWIRVRGEDGDEREVSLLELFEQAPHIKCLANDLPTQDFAILRVLLAILQRSISPKLDDDNDPAEVWGRLWNAPELPLDAIREYLGKWHDRFDLFDEEKPFMQVAGLQTAKNEVSEIKKIVADVPDGDALFSLRMGRGIESLSYPEAARWVVHVHAFDTSGIKSGTVGDPRVKGGKSYPIGTGWSGGLGGLFFEGKTLFETVILNFIARDTEADELFSDEDVPYWERPCEDVGVDNRVPTGRTNLYTWQSRRLRLIPADGRVIGVVLTNGDKLDPKNLHQLEPMTAWRRSEVQEKKLKTSPVFLPHAYQSGKALWRGLDSLFGSSLSNETPSVLKPDLVEWLAYLSSRDGGHQLDRGYLLKAHAVGFEYGTQSSVIKNAIDDYLELSPFLLTKEGEPLVALAKECVSSTSQAINALGDLVVNLRLASGEHIADAKKTKRGPMGRAYFEVDSVFRSWFANLDEGSDAAAERARWHRIARSVIEADADNLLRGIGSDAVTGALIENKRSKRKEWMTASKAESLFRNKLREALPLEEDTETKKEAR